MSDTLRLLLAGALEQAMRDGHYVIVSADKMVSFGFPVLTPEHWKAQAVALTARTVATPEGAALAALVEAAVRDRTVVRHAHRPGLCKFCDAVDAALALAQEGQG